MKKNAQRKKITPSIKDRIREITNLLKKWNYEYWTNNNPTVEDSVYDRYMKELSKLEEDHDFAFDDSPSRKIGRPNSLPALEKVTREFPMLSLDSFNNYNGLVHFEKRIKKILKDEIDYICEWKIDGLSVSLIYEKNELSQVSTRGDGFVGEDVTFNKETIENIPFYLPNLAQGEIRGEVFMKKSDFINLNEEIKKNNGNLLANPRNAAAGSVRAIFSPFVKRKLNFFAYQLLDGNTIKTQNECLEKLLELGFLVSPNYKKCKNLEEVWNFIQDQEKKRDNLDFESDGIVVKINNYNHWEKLGQTSKFPRWAIAYKFPASFTTSSIKDIQTEVSRSGRISYVALIESVILQGSKINKVSLHNYSFIRNLKVNIGDEIVIKKAGDVIPQIDKVIKFKEEESYWIPSNSCPSCDSLLVWNCTNIFQVCLNNNCPQKIINYLTHFASKSGLDIKGLSQKNIKRFYQRNLLKSPADFYYLYQFKQEIIKIEGFKEKSIQNILNSIEISKKKSFANLLSALGVPLLSSIKAKKIVILYPNLTTFISALEKKEWEKIKQILGEKTQKEIENYWKKSANQKLLNELKIIFQFL